MPGSSSWIPYTPQGVKGFDDDDDDDATKYEVSAAEFFFLSRW